MQFELQTAFPSTGIIHGVICMSTCGSAPLSCFWCNRRVCELLDSFLFNFFLVSAPGPLNQIITQTNSLVRKYKMRERCFAYQIIYLCIPWTQLIIMFDSKCQISIFAHVWNSEKNMKIILWDRAWLSIGSWWSILHSINCSKLYQEFVTICLLLELLMQDQHKKAK